MVAAIFMSTSVKVLRADLCLSVGGRRQPLLVQDGARGWKGYPGSIYPLQWWKGMAVPETWQVVSRVVQLAGRAVAKSKERCRRPNRKLETKPPRAGPQRCKRYPSPKPPKDAPLVKGTLTAGPQRCKGYPLPEPKDTALVKDTPPV